MHRRSTINRWIRERWFGKSRRAQAEISRGVVVDQHAAELAALLTAGIGGLCCVHARMELLCSCWTLTASRCATTAVIGTRAAGGEPRARWLIPVAIIFRDPTV
ncbi:hypothetical protein [Streptomyces sp. NPDC005336]|uniref:hypothetical protein n=1 Tax=Streptomyces sp. NPDC005336 TaxID=3157035 RepID=UPI0033BDBF0B